MPDARSILDVADWRRRVFALYAEVRRRSATDPTDAHAHWVRSRNDLFARHPASPLVGADRAAFSGLPVSAYDPAWRFEVEVQAPSNRGGERLEVDTGTDGVVPFELIGSVNIPAVGREPGGGLDVWRLATYGGGVFLPVKDALANTPGGTYGGGRYLLDTVKGADLGVARSNPRALVLDLNFAYNPSCAYDPAWACPLAPPGNALRGAVPVGERMPG
ncbi:DUF1684 domain-containing protein [Planctomonas psychrotolerans]|uniref:DUF1684 domain-containing protein n=1 Tax=Planctomonas psychrotolerans TaxID=2528712 RepID=UPI00123B73EA|nr:DUF1684 domain-containing protein [Planctomonas psychrotolerans]